MVGPGLLDADLTAGVLGRVRDRRPEGSSVVVDARALAAVDAPWDVGAVLTPHPAEMAVLLDCDVDEVVGDPVAAARTSAGRFAAVSLMKGPSTVIATPRGDAFVVDGGGVGMATSGSGDVLAGSSAASWREGRIRSRQPSGEYGFMPVPVVH